MPEDLLHAGLLLYTVHTIGGRGPTQFYDFVEGTERRYGRNVRSPHDIPRMKLEG